MTTLMSNTNDGNDDDDNGIVPFIPDEIENTMNNEDREQLLRYIDSEFLDVLPYADTTVENEIVDPNEPDLEERYDLENNADDKLWNDFNKESRKEIQQALEPRDYKYELFQKAVNENVLAVLDTGSGKTLIAVMLIKHILTKERENRLKGENVSLIVLFIRIYG